MAPAKNESAKRYSYADYVNWPDEERWELIGGEPFDMTPAPGILHQEISAQLVKQLLLSLEGKPCKVYFAPCDVLLPEGRQKEEESRNVVQPDIFVLCDQNKRKEKYILGAPEFVIEILSPHTAGKDQIRKRRLYERHGVKEFWVVHPTDRIVGVYRLAGKTFDGPEMFEDSAQLEVKALPGLSIDFTRVFPPLPKTVRESPRKYL